MLWRRTLRRAPEWKLTHRRRPFEQPELTGIAREAARQPRDHRVKTFTGPGANRRAVGSQIQVTM